MGAFLMALGFARQRARPRASSPRRWRSWRPGYGNGLLLVYERQLIQAIVPDRLAGRVFGVKDALTAWAFAFGFLVGRRCSMRGHPGDDHGRRGGRTARLGRSRCWACVARGPSRTGPRRTAEELAGSLAPTSRFARVPASRARTSSVDELRGLRCSTTLMRASTTVGSNWVPAFSRELRDRVLVRHGHAVDAVVVMAL